MKRWRAVITAVTLCGLIAMLVIFSAAAKEGAREGMALCEGLLLPSLLPMMILSNTLVSSDANRILARLFGSLTETLLHLPRQAAGAVIAGLTCGYPVGTVLTASLYRNGFINRSEAQRLLRFNCGGGIAFTVTAVGSITLHSARIGAALLLINITAALLCAAADGLLHRKEPLTSIAPTVKSRSAAEALPNAAAASLKGLAIMCGFIIFFSALVAVLPVPASLLPLLEITKGVCQNHTAIPLPFLAFFLSFGGLCLHLQLISFLRQIGISYLDFLGGRLACAVLSFILGKLYVLLFPAADMVFCNLSSPQSRFSEGGTALGLVMIAGCAVFVADLKNRKLKFT